MSDPTGREGHQRQQGLPCPQCGALRALDNTPSCSCARRASENLRDTRSSEAAAAEDFDPLRIRPYVEFGNGTGNDAGNESGGEPGRGTAGRGSGPDHGSAPAGGAGHAPTAAGHVPTGAGHVPTGAGPSRGTGPDAGPASGRASGAASGPADVTMPLPAVPADPAPSAPFPDPARNPAVPVDATMPLRAVDPSAGPAPDATTALPTPLAPSFSEPSTTDLSLFEAADVGAVGPGGEEPHRPRRRRALLVASTAAVVAVVAAAGFASGLFSYEKPTRDGAAPEDVRAAVPEVSTSAPSVSASASRSASPSASEASPSPSESESPSPSASESSASPSASPSEQAGQTATPTARVTGSLAPGNGADNLPDDSPEVVVLRRGDKGAEVTELQLRLRQLFLYNGEANGTFTGETEDALRNYQWSRGTTGDGLGVYGQLTRTRLEAETTEP
ncbi:peptidoglycan-binding protein [Streptomyces sp. MBT97]|uniref:peptidoglycan-binding protein n=1 Tax=Streptomyces sp. MBT97 TaxID=2800411 RepID=UPI00190C6FFC|nr:peptidoglycan-binding domain-containing protein [Streptomyces sp. MBT97]MBK3637474.1 peptidoglycan-binding protein [Streptomyces sp. MBT97]